MNHLLDADSKENRLTCHPVGRPLSAVGFTNAESQAGANAALSDNDLLSRPRTSNAKKNQKQSPASPVCPASPGFQVGVPDNHLQNLPLSLAALAPPLAGRLQKRPMNRATTLPPGGREPIRLSRLSFFTLARRFEISYTIAVRPGKCQSAFSGRRLKCKTKEWSRWPRIW
jgi:hypothetical protein